MVLFAMILVLGVRPEPRVSFCATGDVMLARGIKTKIGQNNVNYPFEQIEEFIAAHDLAFCNLECPISARGRAVKKPYCFRADTTVLAGIKDAGFDIFSLANNHTLDWGEKALLDTKGFLDRDSLFPVGAGTDQTRARQPAVVRRNGLKIAFFAFIGTPLPKICGPKHRPGPAQAGLEEIVDEVGAVREDVDFVIVSFHWGNEYQSKPTKQQIEWAHRLIDSGVDLVIGHHPHVLQSVELYKDRVILYSLGNFIFDQRKTVQRQSAVFSCVFRRGRIDSAAVTPVWLEQFRPGLASDTNASRIAARLASISQGRHAYLQKTADRIYIADRTGQLGTMTPLARRTAGGEAVRVYRNRLELESNQGTVVNSISSGDLEWTGSVIFPESSGVVAVVTGRPAAEEGGARLDCFKIKDQRIEKLKSASLGAVDPRALALTDIEGDSVPDIVLGYAGCTRDSTCHTGLCLYRWEGDSLALTWSGRKDYLDFGLNDVNGDGLAELLTLNPGGSGAYDVVAHQWCGFGFFELQPVVRGRREAFLSDLDLENLMPRRRDVQGK